MKARASRAKRRSAFSTLLAMHRIPANVSAPPVPKMPITAAPWARIATAPAENVAPNPRALVQQCGMKCESREVCCDRWSQTRPPPGVQMQAQWAGMLKYASMSAVGVASYTAHLLRLRPPIGRIMGLAANPDNIAEIKESPAGWRERQLEGWRWRWPSELQLCGRGYTAERMYRSMRPPVTARAQTCISHAGNKLRINRGFWFGFPMDGQFWPKQHGPTSGAICASFGRARPTLTE